MQEKGELYNFTTVDTVPWFVLGEVPPQSTPTAASL
jgi:hypothetical protein